MFKIHFIISLNACNRFWGYQLFFKQCGIITEIISGTWWVLDRRLFGMIWIPKILAFQVPLPAPLPGI